MELLEIWVFVISLAVIAIPLVTYLRRLHREQKEVEELFS